MSEVTRRDFLGTLAATPLLWGCSKAEDQEAPRQTDQPPAKRDPMLDIHVHLFGSGDSGSGCHLSKKITTGFNFAFLIRSLDLDTEAHGLDRAFELALARQVRESGLDKVAVLAQDWVYDGQGRPDRERTHFYVPNDYLFEVTAKHKRWMTPCVSINPDRRDCVEELSRCARKGARLLKIHPPTQGVDISDKKHARFFARCAELDILVMVHTGHEHAAPVLDIDLADPYRLTQALDAGCRVVACHSGSGWASDRPDYFAHFLEMVERHQRLWGDTSVMATGARNRDLGRAIQRGSLRDRLVHGSDFPFPSHPLALTSLLDTTTCLRLQGDKNLIRRDFAVKQALGIGRATAERSYRLVFGG
ncbi:MAG: amidohydrolase family protein [Planctomycetota bacterium]|jgi:mannonate dehydratase